jgi:hypothetical protein
MREYIAQVQKPLETLSLKDHSHLLNPDHLAYGASQQFGETKRLEKIWGLVYPSVRRENARCVAIFRPSALSIPVQGCHLAYIWDGKKIVDVRKSVPLSSR